MFVTQSSLMHRILILPVLVILSLLSGNGLSAQELRGPRISASTRQFLWKMQQQAVGSAPIFPENVYYQNPGDELRINAFLQVSPDLDEQALKALDVWIGVKAGNIWTARIPVRQVEAVSKLPGLMAMDLDQPAAMDLDSARRRTRVDSLHRGLGLPHPFAGDSVVVGIIDAGFDYTHPVFYDTSYTRYRVRKVWEQKTTSGTAPLSFGYGTEFADSASIHAKAFDVIETTHGTHVGGIAAGSGYNGMGNNHGKFRGMAYNSELVFVAIYPTPAYWLNTGMADFLDGIAYTFQHGQSKGWPAVANLSWGCPLGPRDGSSLFSQACDNLTGPGKIFVVSGGNNGANKIHLKKTFTPTDTLLSSFTTFSTSLSPKVNQIDVWGDTGRSFQMQFFLYNGNTRVAESQWVNLDGQTQLIKLKGSNGDTCFITATGVLEEFNQKPHMLLQFLNRVGDRVGFSVKASSGTVHLWQGIVVKTSGYYGTFTKYTYTWASDGDVNSTCGDLVSTRSALAVAAYNSKVSFTNVAGQALSYSGYVRGRIAAFSSLGPTADGRVKPNIAGPGLALASAFSSYDTTNLPGGTDYSSVVFQFNSERNGRRYPFGMAGGTSMSAPAVSGITAMLLQTQRNLSPQQLMSLYAQTAIKDNFTGTIPANGSNTWGFGKINAMGAIKALLNPTGITHEESNFPVLLVPNPGSGLFTLHLPDGLEGEILIRVFSAQGQEMKKIQTRTVGGLRTLPLNLQGLAMGCYSILVQAGEGSAQIRVLVQ